MIIALIVLALFIIGYIIYAVYLKEYIDVTIVYKTLRKLLASRDVMLLKIIPDIEDKKYAEKILNLINSRNEASKISYDDAIRADITLHNELKNLYDIINKMDKNELQLEIFKKVIDYEKRIKLARVKYTEVVSKYNMGLTVHHRVCIKLLHMKPLEVYGSKNK